DPLVGMEPGPEAGEVQGNGEFEAVEWLARERGEKLAVPRAPRDRVVAYVGDLNGERVRRAGNREGDCRSPPRVLRRAHVEERGHVTRQRDVGVQADDRTRSGARAGSRLTERMARAAQRA